MMHSSKFVRFLALTGLVGLLAIHGAGPTTVHAAASIPSGEVVVGQTVIEPVYDDMTGAIRYVSTPMHTPNPVNTNPRAWAPFYLPVYPAGSTVGTTLCEDVPVENCPDHGPALAGAARAIMPKVYPGAVIGHDHLMAGPGSGGDFNIAWEPVLVLFTSTAAANEHITTLAQLNAALGRGDVIEIPLPNLTFHCSVVSAAVYAQGTPLR
jgi:hypothetical protein